MAKTLSNMLPLGTEMPDFSLQDVTSQTRINGKSNPPPLATVVMFICNHCPFVKHLINGLVAFSNDYQLKGIKIFAINSNDISKYPDDAPEHMARLAKQENFSFPYLFDETQAVASAFKAACTPDFFVYDAQYRLAYRGQFDDSRPSNDYPVTGKDLRQAVDCLLRHEKVSTNQIPSIGCNIKWK